MIFFMACRRKKERQGSIYSEFPVGYRGYIYRYKLSAVLCDSRPREINAAAGKIFAVLYTRGMRAWRIVERTTCARVISKPSTTTTTILKVHGFLYLETDFILYWEYNTLYVLLLSSIIQKIACILLGSVIVTYIHNNTNDLHIYPREYIHIPYVEKAPWGPMRGWCCSTNIASVSLSY